MAIKKPVTDDKRSSRLSKTGLGLTLSGSALYGYGEHLARHASFRLSRKIPGAAKLAGVALGATTGGLGLVVGGSVVSAKANALAGSPGQKGANAGRDLIGGTAFGVTLFGGGGAAFDYLAKGLRKGHQAVKAGAAAAGAAADLHKAKKTAAAAADFARKGKDVTGQVIGKNGQAVKFVRIRGRIVPIRQGISKA